MQRQGRSESSSNKMDFDIYTIVRDILRQWWVILLVALSAMLLFYVRQSMHYCKQYTVTSTFVVTNRGLGNNVYENLSSARETAESFSTVLNSSVMQKAIAADLGLDYMPCSAKATVLEETNLMTVSVTGDDPRLAFLVIRSIVDNYDNVIEDVLNGIVLDIIQEPNIPMAPDNPFSPWRSMCKVFVVVVVVLCGALGLLSYLRDTIRSEHDIERKLDVKKLGVIYHENKYKTFKGWMKKAKIGIVLTDPAISFRYVESMKKVASKLRSQMNKKGVKTILITSIRENEGKSTVATNLALALAEESKKVLLIDADLRKPALYKLFNVKAGEFEDLGEVLNGKKNIGDLVFKTQHSDLQLILNSLMYANSTEMISAGLLEKLIAFLREEMDYIIIDSSPMALVADTEVLSYIVDASVLVVRQHMAEAREINDAAAILRRQNKGVLGCIFNDVISGPPIPIGNYGDYGRYGYGRYGYGRYGYGKYGHGGHYASRNKKDR